MRLQAKARPRAQQIASRDSQQLYLNCDQSGIDPECPKLIVLRPKIPEPSPTHPPVPECHFDRNSSTQLCKYQAWRLRSRLIADWQATSALDTITGSHHLTNSVSAQQGQKQWRFKGGLRGLYNFQQLILDFIGQKHIFYKTIGKLKITIT